MKPGETMGDLRSALSRVTADDLGALEEVAFTLAMASIELEHPDMLGSMMGMARDRLEPIVAGNGRAWDRVEFAVEGARALSERVASEAPWVEDPARAAATWLGALCWQMTAHFPSSGEQECVHVYMGLGGGRDIRLLWDVETKGWFRYVLIGRAADAPAGAFTHNATDGRPGLPSDLTFGPDHVDEAAAARALEGFVEGD